MIIIHFKKGGRVQLNPKGYPGRTCHEATRPYEQAFRDGKTVHEGEEEVTQAVTQTEQVKLNG